MNQRPDLLCKAVLLNDAEIVLVGKLWNAFLHMFYNYTALPHQGTNFLRLITTNVTTAKAN